MKTIRLLISSPGDVLEERDKARQVIEQLQRRYAGRLKLAPVLWEDLPLQLDMSFQQGIDLVLSADRGIDIAVFILWARLGSPTGACIRKPDGSEYRSGTEREFDLMLRARENSGGTRPAILAYIRKDETGFKERLGSAKGLHEIEELVRQSKLVDQFIHEEFHDPTTGANTRAYHTFPEPASFASRLRVHLIELIDPLLPDQPLPEKLWTDSPFRGLEVFDLEHAPIYFGREQAVCDVQLALREQARKGCAFVLIVGASGSGKSSLARAGVLAGLAQENLDPEVNLWRKSVLVPGTQDKDLCLCLAEALASERALPELREDGQSLFDLAEALAKDPELAVRLRLKSAIFKAGQGKLGNARLLLLVDQLEELFAHASITVEAVTCFIKALNVLARSGRVWVLATVRSDFYARCQTFPVLMAMKEGAGQYDLLPPTPAEMHRIIEQPVWLAGLRYEQNAKAGAGEGLDQVVFNDAIKHPEALPLLEYLLRELYEQRTAEGVLTFAAYEALGGVEGALGRRAEALFGSLRKPVQAVLPGVLNQLVTVNEEEEIIVVRQGTPLEWVSDSPERKELVERFLKERLFVADRGPDGVAGVQVAHEALLRRWERAALWARENRDSLRARKRLEQAHARWVAEDGNPDFLLSAGKPLADAEALLHRRGEWLTAPVRKYVRISAEAVRTKERKRYQRLALACCAFFVLVIAMLAFGWRAHIRQQRVLDSLAIESNVLAQVRIICEQAEPLATAGALAVSECEETGSHARESLNETQELIRSRTTSAQKLSSEFTEQILRRVSLEQDLSCVSSNLSAYGEELLALCPTHAAAVKDAARAQALHASCLQLYSKATNLTAHFFEHDLLSNTFRKAAENEEQAYRRFKHALGVVTDYHTQTNKLTTAMQRCATNILHAQNVVSETEQLHLSLGRRLYTEVGRSLTTVKQSLAEHSRTLDGVSKKYSQARREFEKACDRFAAACLKLAHFERLHRLKEQEWARAHLTESEQAEQPLQDLKAFEPVQMTYASEMLPPPIKGPLVEKYPGLKALLDELQEATLQVNEVGTSLGAFAGNLGSLAEKVETAGRKANELRAQSDLILSECRQLRDGVEKEYADVQRALQQVAETEIKVADACRQIRDRTDEIVQSTTGIDSRTERVSLVVSLFGKSPSTDSKPVQASAPIP